MQVAHFYNTIDQQMIPSQRPLMLESALNFERIIKKPKAATKVLPWNNLVASHLLVRFMS